MWVFIVSLTRTFVITGPDCTRHQKVANPLSRLTNPHALFRQDELNYSKIWHWERHCVTINSHVKRFEWKRLKTIAIEKLFKVPLNFIGDSIANNSYSEVLSYNGQFTPKSSPHTPWLSREPRRDFREFKFWFMSRRCHYNSAIYNIMINSTAS